MKPHRWDNDESLMADLAEAMQEVAPLSTRIAEQARGALTWRTVDTDLLLATLHFDSSVESSGTSRAGESGHRVLVFHAEPLAVEVELHVDRIFGQIVPPSVGEVTLESAGGERVQVAVDDLGFFVLSRVPRGSIRLRCKTPTTQLVTDWFQP